MTTIQERIKAVIAALNTQTSQATQRSQTYILSHHEHMAEVRAYKYAISLISGVLEADAQPEEYRRAIERGEDLPSDDETEAVMWRFAITQSGRAALNDYDDEGDQGWAYPEFGDDDDLDDLPFDDDDEADTKELVTITDAQIANWGDQ